MQISYSKRARGTSANKEFGLRRESGLWRGNLFPFFAIASNFKLIVPALLVLEQLLLSFGVNKSYSYRAILRLFFNA